MESSRSVSSVRSASGGNPPSFFSCNKCGDPMQTNFFVCACDCAFCEACATGHFQRSSRCPLCGQTLSSDDFLELGIANPSVATKEYPKVHMQYLMTKFSSKNSALSHQEMCSRLLKQLDNDRRSVRFMLKQFVFENGSRTKNSGDAEREIRVLKQENTALKKELHTMRIQTQHEVEEMKRAFEAVRNEKNEQKEQNQQLRKLLAAGRTSSRSIRSGSSAGGERGPRYSTASNIPIVLDGPPGGDRGPRFDREVSNNGIPRQVAVVRGLVPTPIQAIPPNSPSGRLSTSSTIASATNGYRFYRGNQSIRSGVSRFGGAKRQHSTFH